MARDFTGSTANYLSGPAPVTAQPLTMACWIRPDDVTFGGSDKYIMELGDTGGTSNYAGLLVADINSRLRVGSVGPSGARVWEVQHSTVQTGVWQHVAATFTSSTSVLGYLDGDSTGTAITTGTGNFTSIDVIALGVLRRSSIVAPYDGLIAWPAMWDVVLSDAEVAALAAGAHPLTVRPESIVAFWPLSGSTDAGEKDIVGTYDLTETGTVGTGESPVVVYSGARRWQRIFATGGGGGFQPAWARGSNTVIQAVA